jgi:hypothetical protein
MGCEHVGGMRRMTGQMRASFEARAPAPVLEDAPWSLFGSGEPGMLGDDGELSPGAA